MDRAILTPGLHKTDRIKDDPTDNKFLSAAIEANVFQGIKIIEAKGFVERVRRG